MIFLFLLLTENKNLSYAPFDFDPYRDGCKCPICPDCKECPLCHECPSCPEFQPCLKCKECPKVERCKRCQKCPKCKEPVVFYVPNFAPLDPTEDGIPSAETSNIKPGMCCRCPKRKPRAYAEQFIDKTQPEPLKPIDPETGKYIDDTNSDETATKLMRIYTRHKRVIKKLKEQNKALQEKLTMRMKNSK